jgi:hypothetical protein
LDLLSCTEVAEEVFTITGRDPMIEIAKALQDAALSDEYFVQVGGKRGDHSPALHHRERN